MGSADSRLHPLVYFGAEHPTRARISSQSEDVAFDHCACPAKPTKGAPEPEPSLVVKKSQNGGGQEGEEPRENRQVEGRYGYLICELQSSETGEPVQSEPGTKVTPDPVLTPARIARLRRLRIPAGVFIRERAFTVRRVVSRPAPL